MAEQSKEQTAGGSGESLAVRPHHSVREHRRPDPHRNLRQWLNLIFMVGAVAGVAVYWFSENTTLGIIIILCAMVFKMAECAFRFFR